MGKIYTMDDVRSTVISLLGTVGIVLLFALAMVVYIAEYSMIANAVAFGVIGLIACVGGLVAVVLSHLHQLEWQIKHLQEEEA